MKTFLSFAVLLLLSANLVYSQSAYTNVLISSSNAPEEPSICINPKNTNIVVAGANIDSYYYSTNGGTTWTNGTLTSTYQVWGDPIIACDTAGSFYYFHLVNGASFIDRMGVQKSTNNGVTWSAGTFYQFNPPKQQDKEGVCVDWTHGPRGNTIYVTWTQFDAYGTSNPADSSNILFAKSTDGGATFGSIVRINRLAGDCVDADYTMEGAVPAVGPNGEIYDAWAGPNGINSFVIFFNKSTDGGTTWLANPIIAGTQPGGWDYGISGIYRANGLPCTVCDISNSPYRGTIYVNYTDSAGPADHDVKVIKSTNGGVNWSAPVRVNDDPAGREQFFSWMAIDQTTGYLYCVFYDRRNTTGNNTDVYMARSTNGGITWINERISESSFNPNQNTFFGDYTSISAVNGHVRPIWARLVGGSISVWTALIDFPVGVEPVSNEIPSAFVLHQNYPNPFNPTTKIRFELPKQAEGNVTLKVYDLLGKEAASLINGRLSAGTYEINWDPSDCSSGVYFYTLEAGSFKETKRMVIAK